MSTFFDHLFSLSEIETEINSVAETNEQKIELWGLVDEMVHYKVMETIFDNLGTKYHDEFIKQMQSSPHDKNILQFLKEKVGDNVEELLKQEIGNLAADILGKIALR